VENNCTHGLKSQDIQLSLKSLPGLKDKSKTQVQSTRGPKAREFVSLLF
jgi:hypothetical protein